MLKSMRALSNREKIPPIVPSPIASRRSALKYGLAGALSLVWWARDARAQTDPAAPASPPSAAPAAAPPAPPATPPTMVDTQNFSFDALTAAMRNRAAQPYQAPGDVLPQPVQELDYDGYRRILFRRERTVWANEPLQFQMQAYFPGFLYKDPTHVFIGDGTRFQLQAFSGADFEFLAPLDPTLYQGLALPGVAGFRLNTPLDRPDLFDELVSFLGASYFRALGMNNRYGLSARGLALNTATSVEEEFPRFTNFYVVKPQPGEVTIQIFAELDSPSLAGAYSFLVRPGVQTVIDVTARLFFRSAVERLGVAPLTSMYHFGENDHNVREDFRPEIHDSDGLSIQRPSGEHLWRPLKNPDDLALSYFGETSPRAFGLLQRDRDFSHYQDVEAHYELRPSLMIEPMGDWGRGIVQLVEIPTNSEVNDNIVAFWVPEEKPQPGSQFEFRYRMRWGFLEDALSHQARVTGTFAGVGGNGADTAETDLRRFEINFGGGTAQNLPTDAMLTPIVDVPENARLVHTGMARLPDGGWRLSIELQKLDAMPVELRAKLLFNQTTVSETWHYQWTGRP
ncbi:glucans biosynthesis protein [Aureimonas jatrophae]|jgi:periplasmic glucans biosynthesis protein|uniref:Glucans biosynthesis protein n=1 Tax=Aureimonas jatrophae TaxID=1166073 RepID=A0A1H0D981_9HYPH|nr:glucans biosynthesis protein [Aureimonas jatrophae]